MSTQSMTIKTILTFGVIVLAACAPQAPTTPEPAATLENEEFIFGVVLVGPQSDRGWSQAHYEGGQYVEANLPNSRMVFIDNLNPSVRPETTLEEAVDEMVSDGAKLIFITSDDFAADTQVTAENYPGTVFIHVSGDHVLRGDAPPNLGNYMLQMEFGKMIAGCAAALTTNTGSIGHLGPLINAETRRLANASYLGSRYCYEHYRSMEPATLRFEASWIGFWFHIPGVTSDPVEVANELFDGGVDVIISGIDTTEALVVAEKRTTIDESLYAISYDYKGGCDAAPDVCLGVPYYNWGPGYLRIAREVQAGTWTQSWEWTEPDWSDLNNADTSSIGFVKGSALTEEQSEQLDQFISGLANGSMVLFKGPLNYQDGSEFLANNEVATDEQVWYMPQLLEGMEGLSD